MVRFHPICENHSGKIHTHKGWLHTFKIHKGVVIVALLDKHEKDDNKCTVTFHDVKHDQR